jgi:hypothetical protein
MLGFDRGGAYPSAFTTCRDAGIDWSTYRRSPLAAPQHLPVATTITRAGKQVEITLTDETTTINDYGPCRQITLLEHGQSTLQILTSDLDSCAGALIAFLCARWRIENLFKYLDFYGIDTLADYTATIKTNTRLIDNPAPNPTGHPVRATDPKMESGTGERDHRLGVAVTRSRGRAKGTTGR